MYVDGEKAETFEVLDCLMAVELAPGEHTITMRYWPWCVTYGLVISISSLVLFAAIAAAEYVLNRKRDVIEFRTAQK